MTDIITEAKQRLQYTIEYESEFRDRFLEDLRFVYDDDGQWEDTVLNERSDRPCYTFNRVEGSIDQVVGDQRQTRPAIKIRAAEGGDKKLAETISGLVRNIQNVSDAETVYDHAFTYAVAGGYGVWRIVNEFNADDSFDQDIKIKEIANPLTAYADPAATDICKRDARFWFITERIPREQFEETYKDKIPSDFVYDSDDDQKWYSEDEVRIAEYYRKITKKRELVQLSDGRVTYLDDISDILDELAEQSVVVKKSRTVDVTAVEWFKLFGDGILEGPIEYPWKYIPVVPVYGKRINIEGEYRIKGLTRNAKDPQRSYNYIRSVITEKALLAPKFSYILTPEHIKGYQSWWDSASSSALPYIMANSDPKGGGLPQPALPQPVPVELVTIAQMDADDIKSATGFFDASLGQQSNETSGKAILARQREGDVGSYVYIDNLSKAIRFTGEILVDMIPRIYDTERTVRVLGEDGAEEHVTLNQTVFDDEKQQNVILNDLSQGKYDVAVTVGPSYTTLRQEAAERLIGMGQTFPDIYTMGADVLIKNMDIPGSDELEKRFRKNLIAAGTIEPTDEEQQEMTPPQPDPVQILSLQKLQGEIEKLQAQVNDLNASAAKKQVEAMETASEMGMSRLENVNG